MLIGVLGCGKKASPVAPESVFPMAIDDLTAAVTKGAVILRWTIPERNTDGSKLTDLKGFKVLRSDARSDSSECPGCPKRFREMADIDYTGRLRENGGIKKGVMEFVDTDLNSGTIYTYKVLIYNFYGVFGERSNSVEVSWDMPKSGDN